jgi:hypothetical protein
LGLRGAMQGVSWGTHKNYISRRVSKKGKTLYIQMTLDLQTV